MFYKIVISDFGEINLLEKALCVELHVKIPCSITYTNKIKHAAPYLLQVKERRNMNYYLRQ